MVKGLILLILLGILVGGCAYQRPALKPLRTDLLKELRKGVTTRDEVVKLFGTPTQVSTERGMDIWIYLGEVEGLREPPARPPSPGVAYSPYDVPLFPSPRPEPIPPRRRQELTLFFGDGVLLEYRLREF